MGSLLLAPFVLVIWVQFSLAKDAVVNTNQHRPEFQAGHNGRVNCRINEKTGRVKLHPWVKVQDKDTGNDGQIKEIIVHESEQPFTARFKKTTGRVYIKPFANYTFNAKRKATYKFTLKARDKGTTPRTSKPLHITCKVVPKKKNDIAVNSYAPVFDTYNYVGRVKEGRTSANIVKVHATDKDQDKVVFGKVCEYYIHQYDVSQGMPFHITHDGVVSLDKPLPTGSPETYFFVVMAADCGGRSSDKGALVNIVVDKDCTPGFNGPKDTTPIYKGCEGSSHLAPQLRLNACGQSRQDAMYSAHIKMQTAHILKGCDRDGYDTSGVHKMCNINKTIDLLPTSGKKGHHWMAPLLTNKDDTAEDMFEFDGNTSVNVPPSHVAYAGDKSFTISTWLWMKLSKNKQFILAATDPERLDRKHFGLYTQGNQLVFIHRQEHDSDNQICPSRSTWTPNIFDVRWHHVVVTVQGCGPAVLYVDGKEVQAIRVKAGWSLHNTDMGRNVVIGARWMGREKKYGDYFEGYLAGLSVNSGETFTEKDINCIFKCKEKIKIATEVPDGFTVRHASHNVIEVKGQGRSESFEKLLQNLVYVNKRRTPTVGRRPLQIEATINSETLPTISLDVMVKSGVLPKLLVSGGHTKLTTVQELKKYGIPIASKLVVSATKCLTHLDSARVEVHPPLNTDESIVNPGALLTMLGLKKKRLANGGGMLIHGLATIEQYQQILREIVFVNLEPHEGLRHTFKFILADHNHVSNIMTTELKITSPNHASPQYDMQAMNRQSKDVMPGAVQSDAFVAQSSGKSFSTVIGVIISCSCLFVFIILVVIIRFRSGSNTGVTYADVPQTNGELPAQEEKTVINVTMNPLEKFEGAVAEPAKEESDEKKPGPENKNEKMNLEWDDAFIA